MTTSRTDPQLTDAATRTWLADREPTPLPADLGDPLAGRYRLLHPLGEGGMGAVYLAEQTDPVRRLVAVKVVRPGMDSNAVLARFTAERQALAVMDHPHIARVLDAGTTAAGKPFFVMEVVRGQPLTAYCDARRLPVPDRLALFVKVCRAVQHAHQKGILHRDIKPSNVLVEEIDGQPVPKVIDFGLAKALAPDPAATELTQLGAVVGTPLYMAPEQAGPDARDVDTRADVYALGALLYELLTGTTPIDRQRAAAAGYGEVFRLLRDTDPPTPSSRMKAASRDRPPRSKELDWVVMTALARDRDRRYDSPSALAADVERYLRAEPVSVGPPAAGYRARAFVRRNRGLAAAVAAVAVALVVGLAGTLVMWRRAVAERDAADAARLDLERKVIEVTEQRTRAEAAEADARGQQREAEAREVEQRGLAAVMYDLARPAALSGRWLKVVKLNPLLAIDATVFDPDLRVGDVIARAAAGGPERFAGSRAVEAHFRHHLGGLASSVGNSQLALDQLKRAEELAAAEWGPADWHTLRARIDRAAVLVSRGEFPAAEKVLLPAYTDAVRGYGDQSAEAVFARLNLAAAYAGQANPAKAAPLIDPYLAANPPGTDDGLVPFVYALTNQAQAYLAYTRFADARPYAERAHALCESRLGFDHPLGLRALSTAAAVWRAAGELDRAGPPAERAVATAAALYGRANDATVQALGSLGLLQAARGQAADAIRTTTEVLELNGKIHGPDHWNAQAARVNLGILYTRTGDAAKAVPLLTEAHARYTKTDTAEAYVTANAAVALGDALTLAGKPAEAEAVLRPAAAFLAEAFATNPLRFDADSTLGGCLAAAGKRDEAETLLTTGYAGLKKGEKKIAAQDRWQLAVAADRLVALYAGWGRPADADKWKAERATYPADPLQPAARK